MRTSGCRGQRSLAHGLDGRVNTGACDAGSAMLFGNCWSWIGIKWHRISLKLHILNLRRNSDTITQMQHNRSHVNKMPVFEWQLWQADPADHWSIDDITVGSQPISGGIQQLRSFPGYRCFRIQPSRPAHGGCALGRNPGGHFVF